MSLNVTIAGTALPIPPESIKDLKTDSQLAFDLAKDLQPYLESSIGLAPDKGATTVKYTSDAASWNPGGSAVTFGLSGGAACSLQVVNAGSLGRYVDGLQSPTVVDVVAPAGHSYVKLTISFNLSANLSAKYSGGAYGMKASLSTKDSYAVTLCKAFLPTVKVRDAIVETFASFVLPFRSGLLTDMADGDFLWYEFDGNQCFALGAYAGLDEVLYAGNGTADVIKVKGGPLATLTASVKPEIKLAAGMDFKLGYEARFAAVLSKVGTHGQLHLCKSETETDSVTASAGLTINVNAEVSLAQKVSDHLDDVKASLVQSAGGDGSDGGKAVGKVADAASGELDKYAAEVTDKLQCWLNKADGHKCNLQVAIEQTRQRLLLATYDFDLTDANFTKAWQFAVDGDFFSALNTSGMTLQPGSGLEREYRQRTSFRCNFFNLWHFTSWDQFSSNVTMIYAGNNVFHMLAKVGRSNGSDTVGSSREMDLYFSVAADVAAGKPLSNVDISLNMALNGNGDKRVVARIAKLLSAFDPAGMASVARDLVAFNNSGGKREAQLLVTIPGALFAKIQADPQAGPDDALNWSKFAEAADALDAWALSSSAGIGSDMRDFLKKYATWEQLNTCQNQIPSPDRTQLIQRFVFPDTWTTLASSSPAALQQIAYSLWAAQRYMNFCAALQQLGALQTSAAVTATWEGLLALVTQAVKQDLNTDFLRPTALATMNLCKGSSCAVVAPAGPALPVDHFSVRVAL